MINFWKDHKILLLGFIATFLLASILFFQLIAGLVYWPQHQDEKISGWMTIGYVARSYDVDKQLLVEAIDIETDLRRHLTLNAISDAQDRSLVDIRESLLTAITDQRASR